MHFFGFRCCAEPWNQSLYQTSPVIYCSSTVQWGHNISVTECGSALSQDVKIVTSSLSKQQFSTDVVKKLNKGLSPRVCLHCLFWATGLHTISLDAQLFYLSCLHVAANGPFPPRQPAAQTLTHPV